MELLIREKAQRKEIKFGNHGIKALHDSKKSLVKCHGDLKADNKYTDLSSSSLQLALFVLICPF